MSWSVAYWLSQKNLKKWTSFTPKSKETHQIKIKLTLLTSRRKQPEILWLSLHFNRYGALTNSVIWFIFIHSKNPSCTVVFQCIPQADTRDCVEQFMVSSYSTKNTCDQPSPFIFLRISGTGSQGQKSKQRWSDFPFSLAPLGGILRHFQVSQCIRDLYLLVMTQISWL